MLKKSFVVLFALTSILWSQTESLFMSRNYKKALDNQTRSLDGKPGKNYWINRSDYKIDVNFNPFISLLSGLETIKYYNNSPDTLKSLVLRLYQDFYRTGTPRDWEVNPDQLGDGVKIGYLNINNEDISLLEKDKQIRRSGTNLFIKLPKSQYVQPNSTVTIKLNFEYYFPSFRALRMGAYDETSYFVGHWYPQMAVYDDIDGWDTFNYYGTCEFYNDFGNFEVNVTVPKDFIVWGTGLLQNPEEVLKPEYVEKIKKAKESDEIINIVTFEDIKNGNITKQDELLTWKFKAEKVPDFAFALSDHYLWDATSAEVENGRRVFVNAAYKKESDDFKDVADVSAKSLLYFSKELPGVPYPWNSITVFNGSGGMEFPMMVNDGSAGSWDGMVGVTSHEIAHSYMPFWMGTNERKWAFMDEGWAVMLPYEFQSKLMKERDPVKRSHKSYEFYAGTDSDLPLMVSSKFTRGYTYRLSAYGRSSVAYYILQNILGKEKFREALQEYISRWHEKHPVPQDFFFTFEKVAGKDLDWFFKPWFFEFGYPDLRITKTGKNEYKVEKVGLLPVPVEIKITFEDGSSDNLSYTAEVWSKGENAIKLTPNADKKIKMIEVGNDHIPDINRKDNIIKQ